MALASLYFAKEIKRFLMALNFANNNSLSAITTKPSGLSGGAMTLISTQTASSSATISFTSGIDDTYDEYVFKFIDIHPATNDVEWSFQGSTNTGSSYGVSITSSAFDAYHNEADSAAALSYATDQDLANSTNFQIFQQDYGNDNDQSGVGTLHLFSPSSTTFVKHFISVSQNYHHSDYSINCFRAGYFNTTSAIDAIQFKFSSGNIDSGVIKLYGVS
ncbi:hypothetical protein [Pelagibacter phage HTVC010P]|uniref:hypothetical protein n=1 Tax=Pelagibacter phage HTVC010P TaxID=1283077 RepID=UPI0002B2827F|nr:hypothetical protein I900_gp30 [Pelagibacter phage HTVC010P]AGE60300.1 hypothetical protein [Pelagibacter phage HTVC010P]